MKVSYNGDYIDFCGTDTKDNFGDFFCTLEQFNKRIEKDYTMDWDRWCDFPSSDPKTARTLVYTLIIIVLVLLILVIYLGIRIASINKAPKVRKPSLFSFSEFSNFLQHLYELLIFNRRQKPWSILIRAPRKMRRTLSVEMNTNQTSFDI